MNSWVYALHLNGDALYKQAAMNKTIIADDGDQKKTKTYKIIATKMHKMNDEKTVEKEEEEEVERGKTHTEIENYK